MSIMNLREAYQTVELFHNLTRKKMCNLVPLLIGGTGMGKTETCAQYAEKKGYDFIPIYVSQLEPSDFVGLYQIKENRTANCSPNWLPYKEFEGKKFTAEDFIASHFPKNEGFINPLGGIIFLDEVNRGHEDIRQALYQFISSRRVHTYILPENYFLVGAANPPEGGYEVYEFDTALVNRFAYINLCPDLEAETIPYLEEKHGRSPIFSWVKGNPSLVKTDPEYKLTKEFRQRSLDAAAAVYKELRESDKRKGGLRFEYYRKVFDTFMAPETVSSLMSFLRDSEQISYNDVLKGLNEKQEKLLAKFIGEGRLDILSTITLDLADHFLNTPKQEVKEKHIKNLTDFLLEVDKNDIIKNFIDNFSQGEKTTDKGEFAHLFGNEYFRKKIKYERLDKYKELLKQQEGGKK